MVAVLARYAARFSVRALDLTVDASLLWVGVGPGARGGGAAGVRAAPAVRRGVERTRPVERQRPDHVRHQPAAAAVRRHADRRVVRAAGRRRHAADDAVRAAGRAHDGFNTRNVLALHVPVMSYGRTPDQVAGFYKEAMRRIAELPGVEHVAVGTLVPWREAGGFGPGFQFTVEGYVRRRTAKRIRARGSARCRRGSSPRSACRSSPAATSTTRDRARQREGRHRQPEPGAAAVPESGCRQSPADLDRSGDEVHRREHRAAADRRRRRRHRRRERRARAGDDRLSPARTGDRRRPPVRPRADRSVSRWCRRSRASSASCRRSSRWSRRRRSRTCGRRCWRRTG